MNWFQWLLNTFILEIILRQINNFYLIVGKTKETFQILRRSKLIEFQFQRPHREFLYFIPVKRSLDYPI